MKTPTSNIRKQQIDELNRFIDEGLEQLKNGQRIKFDDAMAVVQQQIDDALAQQHGNTTVG